MISKAEIRAIVQHTIAQSKGALPLEFTVLHVRLAMLHAEKARIQQEIDKAEAEFVIYQQKA